MTESAVDGFIYNEIPKKELTRSQVIYGEIHDIGLKMEAENNRYYYLVKKFIEDEVFNDQKKLKSEFIKQLRSDCGYQRFFFNQKMETTKGLVLNKVISDKQTSIKNDSLAVNNYKKSISELIYRYQYVLVRSLLLYALQTDSFVANVIYDSMLGVGNIEKATIEAKQLYIDYLTAKQEEQKSHPLGVEI